MTSTAIYNINKPTSSTLASRGKRSAIAAASRFTRRLNTSLPWIEPSIAFSMTPLRRRKRARERTLESERMIFG
jgi:hypothetical protein